MTSDLRTLIASSVKIADIGDRDYSVEGTAKLDSKQIVGTGTITQILPTVERLRPTISMRGRAPRMAGSWELIGTRPDGTRYDANREAQHGIQVDGAVDARIEGPWTIRNFYGDGISVNTTGGAHDPWARNLTILGGFFDEIGRHHVTLDALQTGYMTQLTMGSCELSPVDIEPPGGAQGCRKLTWLSTTITDRGGGFTLANKGVGNDDTVQDIYLGGIRCLYRPFSVTVNPQPPRGSTVPPRRQRFKIVNCAGAGVVEQPQLVFRHTDGIYVRNVVQRRASGVKLVRCIDCTGIDVDVPYLAA